MTGTHLKRWVNILSKYKPTNSETRLLAKVQNFAIAPRRLSVKKAVTETEVIYAGLEKGGKKEADQLRPEVVAILQSAKPPKPNLTSDQWKPITSLKDNKDVLILPPVKGKVVCTIKKSTYIEKSDKLLGDAKTNVKLPNDPTSKEKEKFFKKKILRDDNKKGKIDTKSYKDIYPTAEVAPSFYATPKLHKKEVPFRPIVLGNNSITYHRVNHLADLLNVLIGKSK